MVGKATGKYKYPILVFSIIFIAVVGIYYSTFWYLACGALIIGCISDIISRQFNASKDNSIGYFGFIISVVVLSLIGAPAYSGFNLFTNMVYTLTMNRWAITACTLFPSSPFANNNTSYWTCGEVYYHFLVTIFACLMAFYDRQTQLK